MKNPCAHCEYAKHSPRGKTGKQKYHYCIKLGCSKRTDYQSYLIDNRKYRKSDAVTGIDDLLNQEFVYIFDAVRHIEYVKHLQLALLLQLISMKRIYKAIKKSEVTINE